MFEVVWKGWNLLIEENFQCSVGLGAVLKVYLLEIMGKNQVYLLVKNKQQLINSILRQMIDFF